MYSKVFRQMYDGSLATVGPWEAMVTFQQFLILADRFGDVDMTPEVIARTTTIPLEIIRKGIAALTQPDPASRSPGLEGRRLALIDPDRAWGWNIVNYEKYAAIRSADDRREYKRKWAAENRAAKSGRKSTGVDKSGRVDPSDSDSYSPSNKKETSLSGSLSVPAKPQPRPKTPVFTEKIPAVPYQEISNLYNQTCLKLTPMKKFTEARRKAVRARWKDHPDLAWWEGYFRHVATKCKFLNGNNDKNWTADFDFVTKASKMAKIMEGGYDS